MALVLTLGLSRTPTTEALFDGTVRPEGVRLTCRSEFADGLRNAGERHRRVATGALDGGECSTASFMLSRARGAPLIGLPVFPRRGFSHRRIFRHAGAPVRTPADLAGHRVTVHRYGSTTAVWARGLLEGEYGVRPGSIRWFTAETDPPGEGPPAGVSVERIPPPATRERALELLAAGALDAALEPYVRPGPGIERVIEDPRGEEEAYFRRAGVFPIIHTVVVRADRLAESPWLARSLLDAFREAWRLGEPSLGVEARDELAWERSVVGEDPYGFRMRACDRRTLAEFCDCLVRQGMLDRPLDTRALFAAGVD